MAQVFEVEHTVQYYEGDMTGQLSLPMLLNLAVLSGTLQADQLGIGDDVVHAKGVGWIVLQYEMVINRRPRVNETIVLQTQARDCNAFFCQRQYRMLDQTGQVLVDIQALFSLLDMDKRKLARVPDEFIDAYGAQRVKRIKRGPAPAKIGADEPITGQQDYRVRFTDIDMNQHVNNSRYFDWLEDVLGADFLLTHEPQKLNIRFEQEVGIDAVVTSRYIFDPDQQTSRHQILAGDQLSLEAEVTWRVVE